MIEKSFLDNIIVNPTKISKLEFHTISQILHQAADILKKEKLLLEINVDDSGSEIFVIGDIHGNLESLKRLIEIIGQTNPKFVLFLGDIVDRGPYQLECLILVLALKILFPLKYYILRGNHETLEMNQYYGFFQDFISRFNDHSKFNEILSIYNVLPLCALVNRTILCLHGGIPQDYDILKKLKGQKCKEFDEILKLNTQGVYQIMWNDPKSGLEDFSNSFRGPGIKNFGSNAFENFMEYNNLKYLIRAHECFPEGYRWFFNNRLLSIFSSANYRGGVFPNHASYAIIKGNKIKPKII